MIVANTTIIVGDKVFEKGQAVTGLSPFMTKRYLEKKIISENDKKPKIEKSDTNGVQG